jgi:hypothetical protein
MFALDGLRVTLPMVDEKSFVEKSISRDLVLNKILMTEQNAQRVER